MKNKKVLTGLLSLGLLAPMGSVMPMNVLANTESINVISVMAESVFKQGEITEINGSQYTIKESKDSTIILNMSDKTVGIDAVSGDAVALNQFKVGDKVAAYVSPVSTRSLPPIMNAYVMISNASEKNTPKFHKIGEIFESNDGEIKVIDTTNSVIMTFNSKTDMSAYKTKNIVGLDDIKVGTEIMAWYSVITLSLPGQTTPDKIVILPAQENVGWEDAGNGNWKYTDETGQAVTKWVAAGTDWYYVKDSNMLRNSWIASDSTGSEWYYVDNAGKMVSNTTIDGYSINQEGVFKK